MGDAGGTDVETLVEEQRARISELERALEEKDRMLAGQRQLLRDQTLQGKARSVDEMLALFPAKYPQGNWEPADYLFQDCWFPSIDGLRLHGWYFRHNKPRAAVLFLHGNAGNLSHRAPIVRLLHDRLQVSVLVFDYRGYGRSEGTPTIDGVLRDARAARRHLASLERIAEKEIVLLGESLGGAIAVDLAAEDGAKGLILECTFSSLREVAAAHYPKTLVDIVVADRLDSVSKIRKYRGPLLQCHGDRDQTIPIALARKLFEAANQPKTFVPLPGRGHNDPRTEEYYRAMDAFLTRLAGRDP